MASLRVHSDRLEIHLTPAERTLALLRNDIVVQRENIRSVSITDDPWTWIRGIRAPGNGLPLVMAIGTDLFFFHRRDPLLVRYTIGSLHYGNSHAH